MGRTGHPALILGTAAFVVAAVGTGVALTRDDVPIAKAATNLAEVHDATLVSPAGATTPAHEGERVPPGYVVRTGPAGSAELVTRGRVVYLSHSAAAAVIDGAHQQLRTGRAVYDAQHGDGLRVDVAGDDLSVPNGSAIEVDRSVSVQVGALAGPAQITSSSARKVTVRQWTQAVLNGDALAAATTPLHLNDDAGETHAVPDLVNADERLRTLARGIDASPPATANVITAAWSGPTASLPASTATSEQVLPIVIADATTYQGTNSKQRYQSVVNLRRDGGSWGVILALLNGNPSRVEDTFKSLDQGQPNGQIGHLQLQALGGAPALPNPHPTGSSHPTAPSHPTPSPNPTHPTNPPPTSTPTPTHHPTRKPVAKVVGTVGTVVSKVVKLLPVHKILNPGTSSKSGELLGGLLGK